jgi:hypothetical protein
MVVTHQNQINQQWPGKLSIGSSGWIAMGLKGAYWGIVMRVYVLNAGGDGQKLIEPPLQLQHHDHGTLKTWSSPC